MTEANYTAIAPQCACGNAITRLLKSGKPAKHCTQACRQRAYDQRRRPPLTPKQPPKYGRHCKQCGRGYTYRPAGKDKGRENERGLFCSNACRMVDSAVSRLSANPSCKVFAGHCLGCGSAFVSRRERAYCGELCWPKSVAVSVAPSTKQCRRCGATYKPSYTGGRISEFCGATCRDLVATATKRVEKARRKAVLAGATVERVDPFVVFERDKWRCQLCGIKTPKTKRGTYKDDAPELDHIQPLSKGGEHSYRNTQCSCRKCNGAKSDAPLGQLLLIG